MFALAYVILPFSDTPPADAIRASLARFQRGKRGDVPEAWLAFNDETAAVREEHEARLTITIQDHGGERVLRAVRHGTPTSSSYARRWRGEICGAGVCASPT